MSKLIEVRDKLAAKRKELGDIFAKYPNLDMSAEVADDIKQRNMELSDLAGQRDSLIEIEAARDANMKALDESQKPVGRLDTPVAPAGDGVEQKSIADAFMDSKAFKAWRPGMKAGPEAQLDRKALLTLTGYSVQNVRTGRIEPAPLNTMHVADLIPQAETSTNAIVYMEETTPTNGAATVAEGAAKPESALAFVERTSPVRKIATLLPVTDELMEDAPALRDYINQRLRLFVQLAEDTQLVTGNGTAPNLTGLLNTTGIQTQAKGTDPTPDSIYKAMTLINVNAFLDADGVIFHPLDWQDVRLLRTADGIYIWGPPSEMGPERIWGLNVAKTVAMTQNTALVGAFQYATQIFRRNEITLAVSSEHSTFFAENKQMIRAEERLALVVYRPLGLCTVTGV